MEKLGLYYESEIKVGKETKKIFFQDLLFRDVENFGNLHNHRYTELLIVVGNDVLCHTDNEVYEIHDGECLGIPAGVLHYCTCESKNVLHISVQVDLTLTAFRKCKVPSHIISALMDASKRKVCDVNRMKVSGYMQIIISELFSEFSMKMDRMMDASFIIHEFFSQKYNLDLKLSDLAQLLNLSEKQTARLVEIHKGRTFKQAVVDKRMTIAKHLIAQGKLSLAEVSERVGYQSYGGFYKAYTKYFRCHNLIEPFEKTSDD